MAPTGRRGRGSTTPWSRRSRGRSGGSGCWTRASCGTIEELAGPRGCNRRYVSRVLRLTLLAPDIVEAILDGRQPGGMRLEDLLMGFPLEWEGQKRELELLP